jgi:hypothetical protein
MKPNWPKISTVLKKGTPTIMVDARIGGKGTRRFFHTKREAEEWAQLQRARRQNQGDSDDKELASYGLTVSDAIKFTLKHYRKHHK